ncbi:MAG: hypothetical protein IJ733_16370 [Lachnospiraceae bacterium]|nr:hypothetical protein [Lachnospiraceae bacterium]
MEQEGKALNQYERIVSYLYRYEHGDKKENSGYARVERRDQECRISIQVKLQIPVREAKAYLYIQKPSGIRTVEIGSVQIGRNEMRLKARTEIGDLFGSGKNLEDIDGIFVYSGVSLCYATTWKNDYFYQGDWRQEEVQAEKESGKDGKAWPGKEEKKIEDTVTEPRKETEKVRDEEKNAGKEAVNERSAFQAAERADTEKGADSGEEDAERTEREEIKDEENHAAEKMRVQERPENIGDAVEKPVDDTLEKTEAEKEQPEQPDTVYREEVQGEKELEMQAVCGECPLKKESAAKDYGNRILRTFPTMYPFKDTERGSCVKMELQDIGCLPMRFWSLSGNRFLLHGYYCYRHLLFFKDEQGVYTLGVPGIYNEKEFKNSIKYGFPFFRPIGEEKRHGAFGYWLMKLE